MRRFVANSVFLKRCWAKCDLVGMERRNDSGYGPLGAEAHAMSGSLDSTTQLDITSMFGFRNIWMPWLSDDVHDVHGARFVELCFP